MVEPYREDRHLTPTDVERLNSVMPSPPSSHAWAIRKAPGCP